jgi:MFS family permease
VSTTLTEGLRRYAVLMRVPSVRPMVVWGLLARLPIGMTALALIFLVRGHGGSYADAGAVAAAEALAVAAGSPVAGRLVDRHRPAVVLAAYGAAFLAATVLVVALTARNAPVPVLMAAAAALGATMPPIAPTTRMLWPSLVDDSLLPVAFAFEATAQELIFVSGPLIVGLLTALFSSNAGMIGAGVSGTIGVIGLVGTGAVRDHRGGGHEHHSFLAALVPPLVRRVVVFSFGYGLSFGVVEVTIPAFAELHGGREYGAFALAAWSFGSLTGGLLAAGVPADHPARRLRTTSLLLTLALALPLLAGSIPELAAIMLVCGLPIAPSFAITYGMVQRAALPGTQAEVFGWLSTSIVVGVSLGTAAAGRLVTHSGVSTSFACGMIGAAFATLVAVTIARRPAEA